MDSWSEKHTSILKAWKAKLFVNMWLQMSSSYFYATVHDMLTYPVIIISSISSLAVMYSNSNSVKYILGGLNLIASVLTVLTRHIQPGEKHQDFSQAARRYMLLIRKIDTCIDLPGSMRRPPESVIDAIKGEIDRVNESQLYPPVYVVRWFERRFGNIDQKMFGEDIIELLKADLRNRRSAKRIMKMTAASTEDSSPKSNTVEGA